MSRSTPTSHPPSSTPRSTSVWRYRPELDGLRAFAVVVIVFFHAGVAGASSSFIVLDLFFVLSGFLVTNVVLQEIDHHGRLRLGRYYARRVRRLLPAAVVTIVGTSVLFVLVASEPQRLEFVRHAQAALVYLANWQFIADGADYFAGDIRASPFMHFWSLSVEEQYYIVFPLMILAWWRFAPGRQRVLLAILGVGIALSLASQVYWGQVDPTRAYFATDARLFQLLAGAAAAVALREFATPAEDGGVRWARTGRWLAFAGLAGYAVLGTELVAMTVSHRNILATLVAGALVLGVYAAPASLAARFFGLPWMTYLGKISYGIYLWHYPVLVTLQELFVVSPLVVAMMSLVLAVAMASMSYVMVETPIRRGRRLDGVPWRTVGVGLAASVLLAATVVPLALTSQRPPVVAASAQTAVAADAGGERRQEARRQLERQVPADLDFAEIQRDRGPSVATCVRSDPARCRLVDGDGPHLVLVGDSHARSLVDAMTRIAEERGLRFSAHTVPACMWSDGVRNRRANPERRQECSDAMDGFYDRTLPALDADAVVVAGLARGESDDERNITDAAGDPVEVRRFLRDAVDRTVRRVESAGARTVIIKSMMGTDGWDVSGPDPLDCLARARTLARCAVAPPQGTPLVDSFYDDVAVRRDSASTVDLNPVICPGHPVCVPVIDKQPVWRNADHVSATYFVRHRDEIWRLLRDAGVSGG